MAEAATRLPVKTEPKSTTPVSTPSRRPLEALRQEVDRLFDNFHGSFWNTPFYKSVFDYEPFKHFALTADQPAVDIVDRDGEYEITAELPGIDEKDIEIKLSNGGLLIKGEKKEEKEEKKKDYFLSERHYGSFERYFGLPDGVDTDKIAANFKKGVLTIKLPKTQEALKQEKKIPISAA
jgi:HSP20 family protein